MSAPGSAMCTLCGFAMPINADVDEVSGVATAVAFALHFVQEHPDVEGGVSRYIVMTESPEGVEHA